MRVFSEHDWSGNLGGVVTGAEVASYTFIPSAFLDRAKEIRKRVDKFQNWVEEPKTATQRIHATIQGLTGKLKLLVDAVGGDKHPAGCLSPPTASTNNLSFPVSP